MSESFGGWELERVIAVGGLGEVWRAHRGSELAAVKRLHTHLARNDDARAMFAREVELATTLPRHRHVVHAEEAGEVGGRPYLAMELVDGDDLRRTLAAPPPAKAELPRARAIEIVAQACDAIAHLHAAGWIHGDVAPANLVIEARPEGDRVVLVDLGVAKRIGEAGAVRGTHAYMAPEQVRGEAWTPATDVFALAVIAWELSAGERLFHRGPPWLTMAAVVEHEPVSLKDMALAPIVAAALAKDPARRTRTAAELAARLRSLKPEA